ncbi:hypothetical protein D3C87_1737170 [compost metagenome]
MRAVFRHGFQRHAGAGVHRPDIGGDQPQDFGEYPGADGKVGPVETTQEQVGWCRNERRQDDGERNREEGIDP